MVPQPLLMRLLLLAAAASAATAAGNGCSSGCNLALGSFTIARSENLTYIASLFGIDDYQKLKPYNPRDIAFKVQRELFSMTCMLNGSLERYTFSSNSTEGEDTLSWDKLFGIVLEIVRGLEYLHTGCNPRPFELVKQSSSSRTCNL
ncbi:putative receptor-like protein kinase [Panicum miliaceum]|uniref:Receptor-like protein kinase n=1 Tax=Panicum miliaceum TaxID=4540 RepID=A0A3L6R530_PANMI|nr:putative receptor-like protein kinase [Panicum miliaceum]